MIHSAHGLVEDLLRPEAYPPEDGVVQVRLEETHISWLFFTGTFAYKVKKPVNFGFLDYGTLERRLYFCREELRLNRHYSHDVYLEVVPVVQVGERHRLFGPGEVVDYAVKMRELPATNWLSNLLEQGAGNAELMQRIARFIAHLHREASTSATIRRQGGYDALRVHCRENVEQIQPFVGRTLEPEHFDVIRASTEAFLEIREPLLRRREQEGHVRDMHGDLHAENICVRDQIDLIDCIEFSPGYRCSDTGLDLAFLAMDLDYRGHRAGSDILVDEYIRETGDDTARLVMDFYKGYRACVRGKVLSFQLDQHADDPVAAEQCTNRAKKYFQWACVYARPRFPWLLITCGLMGSGKSTLAHGLASRIPCAVLHSDTLRKELAGEPPSAEHRVPWGTGLYDRDTTDRTYQALHQQAETHLARGQSVIIDASYREQRHRTLAGELARQHAAAGFIIYLQCPSPVLGHRLQMRESEPAAISDGRLSILADQQAAFEIPAATDPLMRIDVDASRSPDETVYAALVELYRHWYRREGDDY